MIVKNDTKKGYGVEDWDTGASYVDGRNRGWSFDTLCSKPAASDL
jgi:hypothetical protein